MSKFKPGALVKLESGRLSLGGGLVAWFGIDLGRDDFILITPEMVGIYLKKTRAKKPEHAGYHDLDWFLFEDKICFVNAEYLVAI